MTWKRCLGVLVVLLALAPLVIFGARLIGYKEVLKVFAATIFTVGGLLLGTRLIMF